MPISPKVTRMHRRYEGARRISFPGLLVFENEPSGLPCVGDSADSRALALPDQISSQQPLLTQSAG